MSIHVQVIEIVKKLSGAKTVTLEHSLQSDLAIDSLNMVTLLLELEDQFQIELKESDMNPFDLTTVESVVNLIERYVEGGYEKED